MITVNDVFDLWCDLKRGLKHNTFQNYKYMYNMFVRPTFGKLRIANVRKTDVKRFYNRLADDRILTIATIDNVHTVLHQVFNLAVDDGYIRINPTDTKGYILCCKNGVSVGLETIGVLYT